MRYESAAVVQSAPQTWAGLAQLVEHLICNQGVTSSNLVAGTSFLIAQHAPDIWIPGSSPRTLFGKWA